MQFSHRKDDHIVTLLKIGRPPGRRLESEPKSRA
jgi:hypothetical protein